MRWRTTTRSGRRARGSRTCPSSAAPTSRASRAGRTSREPRARLERRQGLGARAARRHPARGGDRPVAMRVAIISDVHANRHAFEAVLDAVEAAGAEELWCLGDLVGYGADPDACVALARAHAA